MKRPVSVVVFGLLNIVWGLVNGLVTVGVVALRNQQNEPVARALKQLPAIASSLQNWTFLTGAMAVFFLASGVGLLMMKGWGRALALGCAAFQIAANLVGLITQFGFVVPGLFRSAPDMGNDIGPVFFMVLVRVVVTLVGLSYSVLVIVFMARPQIAELFTSAARSLSPRPA